MLQTLKKQNYNLIFLLVAIFATSEIMAQNKKLSDEEYDKYILGRSFFAIPWVEAPSATTVITSYSIHYTKLYDHIMEILMYKINYDNSEFINEFQNLVVDYFNKENRLNKIESTFKKLFGKSYTICYSVGTNFYDTAIYKFDQLINIAEQFNNKFLYEFDGEFYFDFSRITSYNVCYTTLLRFSDN